MFKYFKDQWFRLRLEPIFNLLLYVFMAQRGWMERCVTFARSRCGIIVLWTLLSDTQSQPGTSEEQPCTLQSWEHPIFTTFCLIWNYFLHFFYLSLQTFFKTISSKYLIAEQANIGLYCITRVTIFVDFFSFAFVSFSLTIFLPHKQSCQSLKVPKGQLYI